jgi:hypothetical protein
MLLCVLWVALLLLNSEHLMDATWSAKYHINLDPRTLNTGDAMFRTIEMYEHDVRSENMSAHSANAMKLGEGALNLQAISKATQDLTIHQPEAQPKAKGNFTRNNRTIAICFFGQVKQYEHVAVSVQRHVFDVLTANGYSYDIYAHTYNQTTTTNPRNREHNLSINATSLQTILRLPATAMLYDRPEDADRLFNLSELLRNGDPWPENPQTSLRNLGRQLHSLRRVTGLWQRTAVDDDDVARGGGHGVRRYDLVLYLRPDVRFLTDLDLPLLAPRLLANALLLATPHWGRWGGFNDRLAFGAPAAAAVYGLRGGELQAHVAGGSKPHAERFLAASLAAHGVGDARSNVQFVRVRADGRPEEKRVA